MLTPERVRTHCGPSRIDCKRFGAAHTKRGGAIHYNALERGIGGSKRIARGAGSTGEALPRLLATHLWFCAAAGDWTRRSKRYHPGFFCRFAGAQKPCCRPQGKRTLSFLSAWGTKIFFGRGTPSHDGNQARKRTTAYPARRIKSRRTNRDRTDGSVNCGANLRTSLGVYGAR